MRERARNSMSDLIVLRPQGLYCPAGDFFIDPWKPVERAVITHGHSDHAREGMGEYFATRQCEPILQWRLGDQDVTALEYGEKFQLNDAIISFHSAGHVLGSAQLRVQVGDEVWVASGDYKRQHDPTCAPFEVVECDTFITEATFGLPIYHWPLTADVARDIEAWRAECEVRGQAAILYAYALGKAQRILAELKPFANGPVYLHGAMDAGVAIYREAGIGLIETERVADQANDFSFAGKLILAPPSAAGTTWLRRFGKAQHGFASGWMQVRGNRRRRNYDRGFVVSDHADWNDLLTTIAETKAKRVIATHGNTDALVKHLSAKGVNVGTFTTSFGEVDE